MILSLQPYTSNELATILSKTDYIVLDRDVYIDYDLTVPKGKEIVVGKYKFYNKGGGLVVYGTLTAARRQIFVNFDSGKVRGSFDVVYPEWWGLEDQKHEKAINCALRAGFKNYSGNKVSLAAGDYIISSTIDMTGSISRLIGAGSGATNIKASNNFNPEWTESNFYLWGKGALHSTLVEIGSKTASSGQSFRGGISNLSISGYSACKRWPGRRISLISSSGYVEENHIIEDVLLSGFTGFGVGFYNPNTISTVNGLHLRNFWITTSFSREAVPIFIPKHSVVTQVECGTIDCRTHKEYSSDWVTIPGTPKPDIISDWAQFGIIVEGDAVINNLHIEGVGIGINIVSSDKPNSVSISNINGWILMDKKMKYYNDPSRISGPPPSLEEQRVNDNFIFDISALVVISSRKGIGNSYYNYNSHVTINNIKSSGGLQYLLRDLAYNIDFTTIGNGRFPNEDSATISFYSRVVPHYGVEGKWPHLTNKWFNGKVAKEKEFTIGPIY